MNDLSENSSRPRISRDLFTRTMSFPEILHPWRLDLPTITASNTDMSNTSSDVTGTYAMRFAISLRDIDEMSTPSRRISPWTACS